MSLPELIIIFTVALLVFGPEKLPEIARGLGKLMADLKRNSDALRREFYNATYKPADDVRGPLQRAARELRSIKGELETDLRQGELALNEGKPTATADTETETNCSLPTNSSEDDGKNSNT